MYSDETGPPPVLITAHNHPIPIIPIGLLNATSETAIASNPKVGKLLVAKKLFGLTVNIEINPAIPASAPDKVSELIIW
ncbi:Uncharacterised protein, partial [Mycoplasma putrefaciens]